ncbi:MAG: carboxyl transferase domain-containing protein, partial [Alphaproteobacteria bacterium]|nr:carboxyl transferase domain-containing protein [Alphaproteobacteria bacterium]
YQISVMGGEQAATVMGIVHEARAKRKGEAVDEAGLEAMKATVRERYASMSSSFYATARLWDDGLIDPRDSRRVLGLCLDLLDEAGRRTLHPNTFGVARF